MSPTPPSFSWNLGVGLTVKWCFGCATNSLPSGKLSFETLGCKMHHVSKFEAMLLNIMVEWKIIQLIDTLGGFVDDR